MSNKSHPDAKIVRVSEVIAPDLMLRMVAEAFFDEIERSEEKTLTLDFTAVRSVSRSFAHQYMLRKDASRKHIIETNANEEVRRMFELASHVGTSAKLVLPRVSRPQLITI